MKHLTQDIECPSCTTLGGPCATTQPARVAWPVFVLEGPVSMSKLVRVARALKVLHGDGLQHEESRDHHIWYTPGDICYCDTCCDHLRGLLNGPHDA